MGQSGHGTIQGILGAVIHVFLMFCLLSVYMNLKDNHTILSYSLLAPVTSGRLNSSG